VRRIINGKEGLLQSMKKSVEANFTNSGENMFLIGIIIPVKDVGKGEEIYMQTMNFPSLCFRN